MDSLASWLSDSLESASQAVSGRAPGMAVVASRVAVVDVDEDEAVLPFIAAQRLARLA